MDGIGKREWIRHGRKEGLYPEGNIVIAVESRKVGLQRREEMAGHVAECDEDNVMGPTRRGGISSLVDGYIPQEIV